MNQAEDCANQLHAVADLVPVRGHHPIHVWMVTVASQLYDGTVTTLLKLTSRPAWLETIRWIWSVPGLAQSHPAHFYGARCERIEGISRTSHKPAASHHERGSKESSSNKNRLPACG
jgi:hypothetical protein